MTETGGLAAWAERSGRRRDGGPGRGKKLAEGKTRKEALRSSGRSATPSSPACTPVPGSHRSRPGTREGICSQRGRITPATGSSGEPLRA
jgi:hypothetical protein